MLMNGSFRHSGESLQVVSQRGDSKNLFAGRRSESSNAEYSTHTKYTRFSTDFQISLVEKINFVTMMR